VLISICVVDRITMRLKTPAGISRLMLDVRKVNGVRFASAWRPSLPRVAPNGVFKIAAAICQQSEERDGWDVNLTDVSQFDIRA